MKKIIALMMVIASMALAACGGGRTGEVRYTPQLLYFDMVDSYGVDTAKSSAALALNPYADNGLFDIFWQVNSLEDYRINFRVNDRPSVNNSYLIYSQVCGAGRACDQDGGAICEYTLDYTMSCNNGPLTDIYNVLQGSSAYLILEVCSISSSYCVYDYHRVLME